MKIWLDDERPMPEGYDFHAWTSGMAIDKLNDMYETVTHISFDHDLGGGDTGLLVAKYLEERAFLGTLTKLPIWGIHSANPVGASNIEATMIQVEKYILQNK